MNLDDEIAQALRGGPTEADNRLAGVLSLLRDDGRQTALPRANARLAAFISEAAVATANAARPSPAGADTIDLQVVQLAPARAQACRTRVVAWLAWLGQLGLAAKLALGAGAAIAAVVVAASGGLVPDHGATVETRTVPAGPTSASVDTIGSSNATEWSSGGSTRADSPSPPRAVQGHRHAATSGSGGTGSTGGPASATADAPSALPTSGDGGDHRGDGNGGQVEPGDGSSDPGSGSGDESGG
ncbi:MAG: hypothetical protein QOE01_41, partial [Actinomycetota bacterium]|nr:hypothetical protein [Actinomycetota bacterium]